LKNGPDDPNDLINILLDWMTDHGNYDNYRGGDKTQIAKTIADMTNLTNKFGAKLNTWKVGSRLLTSG
jgi:hypothetical protein